MESASPPTIFESFNKAKNTAQESSFLKVQPQAQPLSQNSRYEGSLYENKRQEIRRRRREEIEKFSDEAWEEAIIKRQLGYEPNELDSEDESSCPQSQSCQSEERREMLMSVSRSINTFLQGITASDWRRFSEKELNKIRKCATIHIYEKYMVNGVCGGIEIGNDLIELFAVAYLVVEATKLSEARQQST